MNPMTELKEVDRLTSSILDGTISQDDFVRLDKMLYENADKRRRYLEIVQLESLLHWEAADSVSNFAVSRENKKIISFPVLSFISSMAAILLAMAGSWWAFNHHSINETSSLEVVNLNAKLSSNHSSIHPIVNTAELSLSQTSSMPVRKSFIPDLDPNEKSKKLASRVIESLITGEVNIQEGETEWIGPIKRWNLVPDLSIPAEKGILPASGSSMLALSPMMIDMDMQTAQISETVQILDVRKMFELYKSQSGSALLSASVKFNQSVGDCVNSTEYGLTLSAFRGSRIDPENAMLHVEKNTYKDMDSGDWSEINSEMEIPTDTEFVVVSLSAKKTGTDAILANTSNYYSDDLKLTFSFEGKERLGPI